MASSVHFPRSNPPSEELSPASQAPSTLSRLAHKAGSIAQIFLNILVTILKSPQNLYNRLFTKVPVASPADQPEEVVQQGPSSTLAQATLPDPSAEEGSNSPSAPASRGNKPTLPRLLKRSSSYFSDQSVIEGALFGQNGNSAQQNRLWV